MPPTGCSGASCPPRRSWARRAGAGGRAVPIAKGQPWGEPVESLPDGLVEVRSDAEARSVLEAARAAGEPFPALHLLGGDLWRTLGGGGRVRFTVDVGEAFLDGRGPSLFVAHLVARSRLWTSAFVAMNAQWVGRPGWPERRAWNLGPKAHPGDGRLDTYQSKLPLSQVPVVRSRLHHGAHLPHPGIRERRTAARQVDLDRALRVRLDGVVVGAARTIVVRVIPDALVVVVA